MESEPKVVVSTENFRRQLHKAIKYTKAQQPFGKRLTVDDFNSGDIPFEEFKREMDKKWKFSRKN